MFHPYHSQTQSLTFLMPNPVLTNARITTLTAMFDQLRISCGDESDGAGQGYEAGEAHPDDQQGPQAAPAESSRRRHAQRQPWISSKAPPISVQRARLLDATWMRQRHAVQQRQRKRDAQRRRQRAEAEQAAADARRREEDKARQGRRRHEEACRQARRRQEEKDRTDRRGREDRERDARRQAEEADRAQRRQTEDADRAQRRQREAEDRQRRQGREAEDARQRRAREDADRQERRRAEEEARDRRNEEDENRRHYGPWSNFWSWREPDWSKAKARSQYHWDGTDDMPKEPPPRASDFGASGFGASGFGGSGFGASGFGGPKWSSERPSNSSGAFGFKGRSDRQRAAPDDGGFGSPRWWREQQEKEQQQQQRQRQQQQQQQQQQSPRPGAPPPSRGTPFEQWEAACLAFLADKEHSEFPHPPHQGCSRPDCLRRIHDDAWPLATCWHSLQRLLRTRPGAAPRAFVRRFRLHWHPDRFCAPGVGGTPKQRQAEELFKLLEEVAGHMQ